MSQTSKGNNFLTLTYIDRFWLFVVAKAACLSDGDNSTVDDEQQAGESVSILMQS